MEAPASSANVSEPVDVSPARHPPSGRAVLNVENVKFSVTEHKWGRIVGQKDIIKDVSVSMRSGETLAVMGPSGAGKTTFMDLLTLEGAGGTRTGHVELNGQPLTQEVFKRCCSHVPQQDQGWAFLSCRETLQFAAHFYMSEGAKERGKRVEELLQTMGLESCADTKVGNEFLKGLSGGQLRRLSLAVAFLKDPLVVFLDEVTSGLDAASAAGIVKFLQELARSKDVIIVCTIHQPSAKIFSGFDRLLLLSGGRVAYSGRVEEAPEYFLSLGYPIPDHENPADFFLDSVNADFTDAERVEHVLQAWAARPKAYGSLMSFQVQQECPRKAQSSFAEISVLFRRMSLLAMRDPTVYVSRVAVFLCACTFFSLVYINSRERAQDQVLNRIWLLLWHQGVPSVMSLAACLGQNIEFASVRREVKAGMYRVSSYFVAQLMIQIPCMVVMSLSALSFSGYVLANWNPSGFFVILLVHVILLFSYECAAQFFAVSFRNPIIGVLLIVSLWFVNFLFAGFLVPSEDVPWPMRALTYVSPTRWATKAVIFQEFHDSTFEGAVLDASSPLGFRCPSNPMECFGYTGEQVLTSLKVSYFKHLTTESELGRECAIILAVAAAFRLAYFATAAARCNTGIAVSAPETVNTVTNTKPITPSAPGEKGLIDGV